MVPKATRPAPALIPVHSQSIAISSLQTPSSSGHRQSQYETVLNVPSRPNIKISSTYRPQAQVRERRESVEIIQSCGPTQLTAREPPGQIINIGGESFLLPQEPLPQEQQRLVLSQEQARQLLLAQQQGQQQLYIEPQQQMVIQEPQQQMVIQEQQQQMVIQEQQPQHLLIESPQQQQQLLLDPGQQHIFLDEHGRQVLLSPEQQLQLVQQLGDGQQVVTEEQGAEVVQLEGESGERVMLTIPPDHNQLLFQAQEEGMEM